MSGSNLEKEPAPAADYVNKNAAAVGIPTAVLSQTAAAKLLNATTASPAAIAAANDLTFAAIEETADLAASYARSAAEAAWRGEKRTLSVHLADLRLTTIEALRLFKLLGAEARENARPS